MANEELKKKILTIVRGAMIEADELPFLETTDNIADALIAAGIGDTKAAIREFAGVLRDKIFREHSLGTKGYIVGFKEMKERALADVDALVKEVCSDE